MFERSLTTNKNKIEFRRFKHFPLIPVQYLESF